MLSTGSAHAHPGLLPSALGEGERLMQRAPHSPGFRGNALEPPSIRLISQYVALTMSHRHQWPSPQRVRHRHRAKATHHNRAITVDFCDESTYFQVLSDGKAFVEFVLAFILALGFQLAHKTTCRGGGCLTRHSHYARVPLGRSYPLAHPVHHLQGGIHRLAALRLALPNDEASRGPRCPDCHPGWPQFGMVCGDLPHLAHGPLSRDLRLWPTQCGHGADPGWLAVADVYPR